MRSDGRPAVETLNRKSLQWRGEMDGSNAELIFKTPELRSNLTGVVVHPLFFYLTARDGEFRHSSVLKGASSRRNTIELSFVCSASSPFCRDILPRLKARASHPVLAEQVNPEGWESKVCWTVSQWLCHEAITRTPEGASRYLISYRLSAWSAYFLISALNRGEHRVNRQFSTHSVWYGSFCIKLSDSSGG